MPKAKKYNIEVHVALLRGGLFQRDIGAILGLPDACIKRCMQFELPAEIQDALISVITNVASGKAPTKEDAKNIRRLRSYYTTRNDELSDRIDDRTIAFVERLLSEKREFDSWDAEFNDLCDKFD